MSEPTSVAAYDDSRAHLLDELARLDLLIRRHLDARRPESSGQPEQFPGLFVSEAEVDRLLLTAQEATARAHGEVPPEEPGSDRHATARFVELTRSIRARAARTAGSDVALRLVSLAATFELSAHEFDALLLALAPDVDPKYEKVYGYLRDDITKTRPTTELIARILSGSDSDRLAAMEVCSPRSTLVVERLIHVVEGPTRPSSEVRVADRIVEYVLGSDAVADSIDAMAAVVVPGTANTRLYVDDERRDGLDGIVDRLSVPRETHIPGWFSGAPPGLDDPATVGIETTRADERPLLAALVGPDERNAAAAIAWLCERAEIPILRVDARALPTGDLARMLEVIRREARLQSAAIHVAHADALEPATGAPFARDRGDHEIPTTADDRLDRTIAALDGFPGDVFISGDAGITADVQPRLEHHAFTQVAFPRPDHERRTAMWAAVDDLPADIDPAALAGTFRLGRGGIEDAVETARSLADGPITAETLREACRLHSRQEIGELAREIEPTYEWDDIVLPTDTLAHLREIAGAIRHRGTVFEEWGFAVRFSLGNGINVLFTGKSGTGKTMAAEIIARDVGLPLYKLDLSSVMSKYIGETEKNLGRVFDAAADSNAILFFDEADALFGKRTEISDAHDRYANVEVDYLLQRMEEHDGCVILASNLKENIDEAFRRRINASVSFPMPDEGARAEIWRAIFPADTPTETLDIDFLAGFELAGGYIKNVALTAAFLAAEDGETVGMAHVVRALQREFQKTGKLYDVESFGEYAADLE